MSSFDDSKIKTDKATRIATGMDSAHKLCIHNKEGLLKTFLQYYCPVMAYGANKYDYSNFEVAPLAMIDAMESLNRHLLKLHEGEHVDTESHQLHLGHIVARTAIAYMKHTRSDEGFKGTIGWSAEEVQRILDGIYFRYDNLELQDLVLDLEPKKIWSVLHVAPEMLTAIGECKLWEDRMQYTYDAVFKVLSGYVTHLISIAPTIIVDELQLLFDLTMVLAYHYSLTNSK